MRAWYVFVVVGLILSAGVVTYGVMIEHQADQNSLTHLYSVTYLPPHPLRTHTVSTTPTHIKPAPTPSPASTPTPTPVCIRAITRCVVIGGRTIKDRPMFVIPKGYYHYPFKKYKPTYSNLIKLLDRLKCPHKYDPRKFKCSHFAAWLEWYLENHGFRTDIVVLTWEDHSSPPHISGHALDKVYTKQGVFYVDPTILTIPRAHGTDMIVSIHSEIPPDVKLISIHVYHNIYELKAAIGYDQINWWDVLGYPPKVN